MVARSAAKAFARRAGGGHKGRPYDVLPGPCEQMPWESEAWVPC